MFRVSLLIITILLSFPPAMTTSICDLYRSSGLPIYDCRYDNGTLYFSLNSCGRLDFIVTGTTVSVNGRVFDGGSSGVIEVSTYLDEICGGYGIVPSGSPADPIVGGALAAITSRFQEGRSLPGEVEEGDQTGGLSFSQLGTDFGTGSFDANGVEGRSSAALLSYGRDLETGYKFGGQWFYNRLSLDQSGNDFANHTINLFLEKKLRLAGFEGSAGLGYTHLFMDDDYAPEDGRTTTIYLNGMRELGGNQTLNLGMTAQGAEVASYKSRMVALSGLYGLPLTRRSALNVEATWVSSSQEVEGNNLGLDSSFINSSMIYDYYIGDFVINLGLRKIFALDGYSNLDYVLSGRLRY